MHDKPVKTHKTEDHIKTAKLPHQHCEESEMPESTSGIDMLVALICVTGGLTLDTSILASKLDGCFVGLGSGVSEECLVSKGTVCHQLLS